MNFINFVLTLHTYVLICYSIYYTDPLWKVARCTSAAPCYFQPMDHYIDGGLRANNPSEDALTTIQDYHRKKDNSSRLGLVVSVGCGTFPGRPLGDVDVDKYLFFGTYFKQFVTPAKIFKDFNNLVRMLGQAVSKII